MMRKLFSNVWPADGAGLVRICRRSAVCMLLPLCLLTAVSCGDGASSGKDFGEPEEVEAEFVQISEILKINDIVKLEDYIVLQNSGEGADYFYYVYSCPELEFLYSFARQGRGPEEYLMPAAIGNTSGNVIGFRDHATDMLAFYEVSDTAAVLKGSYRMASPDPYRFFWEINMAGDSLLLVKHQGDRSGARELWSVSGVMKDSIGNSFPKLPRSMGKNYYTIFDDYHISASGNRFVFAYSLIDRLEMGEIRGGRICLTAAVGTEDTPEFYLYGDDTATEFSIDRNIVTYENVYAGRDCVYALYSGQRMDDTDMNHSSRIEVYSWNGEPVRLLSLDVPVSSFIVDEDNGVIYAVNPELHEDKILRFRF